MSTFRTYDPGADSVGSLVNAIFTPSSGVSVVPGSVAVHYGTPDEEASTISFYDGSITGLGIGPGLMLTSGDPTPPQTNTEGSYGVDTNDYAGDSDLQATVDAAFDGAGNVENVTWLEFQINVTDPNANGLRFDVVFASDEYPEWSNSSYVDVAGVYVNGTNYALFNNNPLTPLSVLDENLAGNFRDNTGGTIPIEYDGVSIKLAITAPIHTGVNTIKIAVADTGDEIYDSSIFVSGLQPVNYQGYGLSTPVAVGGTGTVQDTSGNQSYTGDSAGNSVNFGTQSGQDIYDAQGGIDDATFSYGIGQVTGYSWNGSVLTLSTATSSTTLVNVEHVLLADGTMAAIDMNPGDVDFGVYSMLWAGFHTTPTIGMLSQWVAEATALGGDLGAVGDEMIDTYAPGMDDETVIAYLYHNIVGFNPSQDTLDSLMALLGGGTTVGDLFAIGAQLSMNTDDIASVIGSIQMLDHTYF